MVVGLWGLGFRIGILGGLGFRIGGLGFRIVGVGEHEWETRHDPPFELRFQAGLWNEREPIAEHSALHRNPIIEPCCTFKGNHHTTLEPFF